MLGVSRSDVYLIIAVTLVTVATIVVAYRRLLFVTFDPEVAEVTGVRVAVTDGVLMVLLAASILVTMNVMGVTLVAAALVVPAFIARLLTPSFSRMLVIATAVGAVTGMVRMNLSYHLDIASGPTIVLTGTALFSIAFLASGARGRSRLLGVRCAF